MLRLSACCLLVSEGCVKGGVLVVRWKLSHVLLTALSVAQNIFARSLLSRTPVCASSEDSRLLSQLKPHPTQTNSMVLTKAVYHIALP